MQILHRFAGSIQQYSEELSDPESLPGRITVPNVKHIVP